MATHNISRREFLRFAGLGAFALLGGRMDAYSGTLRGRSVPLTLAAQRFRCYLSPVFVREVCGGDFEDTISRGEFGISHSLPFVADAVRLKIQVEAIRQAAP